MKFTPPSSISVFAVPTLPSGKTQELRDRFVTRAFVPVLPAKEVSRGWTDPLDPTRPPAVSALDGRFFAIGVRHDQKTVPPALRKLRVDEECRAWCEKNRRETVPRAIRTEIDQAVLLDLVTKTPPKPSTGVVLYDGHVGRLYVGATSGPVHQAALTLWQETFDVPARPLGPLDALREVLPPAELEALAEDVPTEGHLVARQEQLGRFLVWLWWRGESATQRLPSIRRPGSGSELAWLSVDGVTVADGTTRARRLTVKAADAAKDPVLRVALVDGHLVDSLSLQLELDGAWAYQVTIEAKGGELVVKSFKSHRTEGDPDEQLLALAHLVEDLFAILAELFAAWATGPGSTTNQAQAQASLRTWLEGEVLGWAGRSMSWGNGLGEHGRIQ